MSNSAIGDTNSVPAPEESAAQQAGAPKADGQANMNTTISSLGELKRKAPKVYEQMMIGIGMHIVHAMEKSQARLKRLMREQQREAMR
ncbi:MAG: hypothetical protein H0T62_06970 [Parachlamydiaceae bacterium]|nr:hypothetical protein [Parachlamydiaceae bacterium]